MMRSLMHSMSSENQATGQIEQYSKRKYGDNIIVMLAVQKEDLQLEQYKLKSIYQRINETSATCIIVEV